MSEPTDALGRICADTRAEIERRRRTTRPAELRRAAKGSDAPRGFADVLKARAAEGRPALIAEFKRASPSGGAIRPGADPAAVARDYAEAGASCLSVLTDAPYFGGSLDDLVAARGACTLPVLRKDFMLDPWQMQESRAAGADCVLLIMAALSDAQARELEDAAREQALDVLVEVHDRAELERALGLRTSLIGINNRNLKTLQTDISMTERLAPHVPPDRLVVAESGIRTHADLARLHLGGAQAFLVGESLLRQPDVAAAARLLLGGP